MRQPARRIDTYFGRVKLDSVVLFRAIGKVLHFGTLLAEN
jgi:hypothetical protein